MKIEKELWGEHEGNQVWRYKLSSDEIEMAFTNYGCTVLCIKVRGKEVTVGYDDLSALLADKYYMGCLVGRFAGRIADASFDINGVNYKLAANESDTGNHLHGGIEGLNRKCFEEFSQQTGSDTVGVTFKLISDHLDEGYPGKLEIVCILTLTSRNEISIGYRVYTDRATHINLTHHLYYNLGNSSSAAGQELMIDAAKILEASHKFIPTGKLIAPAAHGHFQSLKSIAAEVEYNECYVLSRSSEVNAVLRDPDSGLTMELITSCPAIIFYSGYGLSAPFAAGQGICLETQYFPDAPHHSNFPSTLYDVTKIYRETTTLRFKNIGI